MLKRVFFLAAAAARMPPSQPRTHRYEIAQSRGFQVVTDGTKYTLRRSDIESPSFYITKRYRIKNQPAEYLLQPIANFLGIKATPAGKNFPGYPLPSVSNVAQEVSNSGATNTTITPTISSTQTQPRYEPGLPFDAPLSNWGVCQGRGIRRTEQQFPGVVRATPDEQDRIAVEISRLDREERQILIKTYVVEADESKQRNSWDIRDSGS